MPTHRHDPELLASIGQRLRGSREAAGLTQAELAERLQIEPETLSRYEAGVKGPSVTILWMASKILKIEIASLFPSSEPGIQGLDPATARAVHLMSEFNTEQKRTALRILEALRS